MKHEASDAMESVTQWIHRLKENEDVTQAPIEIWNRYLSRLIALARDKLPARRSSDEDEEDAVLSAYNAFLVGVEKGQFSQLKDRTDLWQILVMLTDRKVIAQIRRQTAAKRGGGKVRTIGHNPDGDANEVEAAVWNLADPQPTPHAASELDDCLRELLDALDDPMLERIAVHKLEGRTNPEIAARLNIGRSTVERKLSLIRRKWSQNLSLPED